MRPNRRLRETVCRNKREVLSMKLWRVLLENKKRCRLFLKKRVKFHLLKLIQKALTLRYLANSSRKRDRKSRKNIDRIKSFRSSLARFKKWGMKWVIKAKCFRGKLIGSKDKLNFRNKRKKKLRCKFRS